MRKMIATRRGFLGLFGGAVAAGPKAVAKVAPLVGIDDLKVPSIGIQAEFPMSEHASGKGPSWAKDSLKKLLKRSPQEIERLKRNTDVYQMPEDIHVLRSVSIGTKLRMAREVVFERNERANRGYLDGVIKGWWD